MQWNKTAPSIKEKDYLAFRVANAVFGKLLFSEIREKGGKTYGIYSNHKPTQFSNLYVIACSVRSDEMANTITLFDKTLQDFNMATITQEDFEKAVISLRMGITSTEMPESILSFYNPVVYDFQKRKNFLTDLAALKVEDVQKIIKKYFTADSYRLVVAGDESVVSAQLGTLKGLVKYKPADIEKDN